MSKSVICVKGLSKVYKLYRENIDRLKETINPFGKKYHSDFYALNDVSFEIKKGESVGIIGKNGAGKSTLLKIIAGVLSASEGSVEVDGKIASLLELGAGFNPEYTGMENIYLQGTLMGYTHDEMEAKVEAILAFADIGEFIHQEVKMYSSGMFARLAFAIVVHVDPDILIVDEALSVGDFAFQYKCFEKFQSFQKQGKTILFVSHSAQQISQYCNKAILIHNGALVKYSDNVEQTLYEYEMLIRNHAKKSDVVEFEEFDFDVTPNSEVKENRFGTHDAIIRKVIISHNKEESDSDGILRAGSKVYLRFMIMAKKAFSSVVLGTSIKNRDGVILWGGNTLGRGLSLHKGLNVVSMEFDLNIVGGEYLVFCGLADTSCEPRVELDQRWPVEKISIVSLEASAEGFVYAPTIISVDDSQ